MSENSAGFSIRLAALLFDWLLIGLPITFIAYYIFNEQSFLLNQFEVIYGTLLPVFWKGYTVGKKIVGIRIVKIDGTNVHLVTMVLRVIIAGIVYGLTLGIGIIVSIFMVLLREDNRAIHDFVANTYVTYDN
ncbi:RDD family protein [Cytobacillus sp. IB215665]|uniref:RDD family protein n=1 Tax=Cytobacillus sp. IB215665 TaxID=3097357 RepID=UPI002A11825F|nr:RDD family protein [Cytobacillus sp. IB215665]MDX8366199.1 RDD family protein [Cytobacillus sp. IB215665]